MQMVIFCGGLATRLGDLAKDTPKSMIKIEGKPFLEYQIEMLKKQSIKDIVLCVGYLSEKIIEYFGDGKKFGVNIRYSHDDEKPLGPIGALKNAEPLLADVFFIMYGDSYLFVDFKKVYSYFLKHDDLALMVTYKNFDKYDASNLVIKNGRILAYGKENKTKDMIFIDYGTSILRKNVLELIPKHTYYSMVPFFSDLIKRKQLLAFEAKKRFYHIGTPEALKEFNDYIKGLD
jgi:N-acetyl-alpha-D-muramate 1-phosphate uridylyltransferase